MKIIDLFSTFIFIGTPILVFLYVCVFGIAYAITSKYQYYALMWAGVMGGFIAFGTGVTIIKLMQ